MICQTCSNNHQENFCPNCGEKKFNAHELTIKHFFQETLESFIHFDSKFLKTLTMETIIIKPKSKQSIPFLKQLLSSLNEVKSVEVVDWDNSKIAKSIDSGLKDVKEILSGKKKAKTLRQLLDEH